jgi:hypothetical protein
MNKPQQNPMNRSRFLRVVGPMLLAAGLGLGLLPEATDAAAAPSARDIMSKVAEARKLDGSEAVVTMKIINESGQTRERKLSMATKLYDGGKTEKRIYRFLDPADVKGTGLLVFDYSDKADDIWVYLPALRKTRRITSSERSKSFMGSEFSYGDFNIPSLDDYDYNLVKEESAGGEACYVIELKPKSSAIAEAEGYSKKTYWVSKSKFAVRKGLYYDLDGKLLKELTTSDIKLLDSSKKRYRAMNMEMVNKQNGRKSVFTTGKVSFAPSTKDEFFTTRYLERP